MQVIKSITSEKLIDSLKKSDSEEKVLTQKLNQDIRIANYEELLNSNKRAPIIPRPYNQFTKNFDSDHIRSGLRNPL